MTGSVYFGWLSGLFLGSLVNYGRGVLLHFSMGNVEKNMGKLWNCGKLLRIKDLSSIGTLTVEYLLIYFVTKLKIIYTFDNS